MSGWLDRLLIQGCTWGSTDADRACAVACYCGLAVFKHSTVNTHIYNSKHSMPIIAKQTGNCSPYPTINY